MFFSYEKKKEYQSMNIHDQDTFLRGKNEGFEAGMQQKAIETAKNMLKDNIDLETVIKYTELSRSVVLDLLKK